MEFIRSVIASLPPGTEFLVGRTPGGDTLVQSSSGIVVSSSVVSSSDATGERGASEPDRSETPLEAARRLEAQCGPEQTYTILEWGTHLPKISGRELTRATRSNAVAVTYRRKTRGNRAKLVSVRAMCQFLEERERAARESSGVPLSGVVREQT